MRSNTARAGESLISGGNFLRSIGDVGRSAGVSTGSGIFRFSLSRLIDRRLHCFRDFCQFEKAFIFTGDLRDRSVKIGTNRIVVFLRSPAADAPAPAARLFSTKSGRDIPIRAEPVTGPDEFVAE